jgi:CRP-like cAMP-binding protein
MKYTYAPELVAVPAPSGLRPPTPSPETDPLQELINRKKEAERNKLKVCVNAHILLVLYMLLIACVVQYHLTEADCKLICTNATEHRYAKGDVIYQPTAGGKIEKVYRVKSGKIGIYLGDTKIKELTTGYFIGEGLFLRNEVNNFWNSTMISEGDVVLLEVQLPFARKLMEVDKVLAFKIYRYIAGKLSVLLFFSLSRLIEDPGTSFVPLVRNDSESSSLSSNSDESELVAPDSPSATRNSSLSSGSSSNSLSSVISSGSDDIQRKVFTAINIGKVERKRRKSQKLAPFKTFPLEGNNNGQCMLDAKKIMFTGCFRQKKIKYNKILDLTKTAKNSVTIIYGVQAKTVFFKTESDLNEFYGLVQSLIISVANTASTSTPSSPSLSSSNLSSSPVKSPPPIMPPPPINPEAPVVPNKPYCPEEDDHATDKQYLMNLAVRQDLKKGDVLIAEGDLYQRVYTIVSGEIASMKGERKLSTMTEGNTFGMLMLFYMRPSMVDLVVTSDTATVLIIPGYKILDLVTTNFPLAVRIYKKAAHLIYSQVEATLSSSVTKKCVNTALM